MSRPHRRWRIFRKTLLLLGEICPSFAYSMARADANDERYRQGILSVIHDALGLTLQSIEEVSQGSSRYDEGGVQNSCTSHPTPSQNLLGAMKHILRVRKQNLKKSTS